MRHTLGMCTIAVLMLPALPRPFGGWTVITVRDLPEYLEAGKPTQLEFTIRQHGRTLLNDRSPYVTVKQAGDGWLARKQRFPGIRGQEPGEYVAAITVMDTGTVEIRIDSDWYSSDVTLVPMRVVARGQAPAPLASHDRGRQLFVAAGCVTCHAKLDDPQLGDRQAIPVGPVLTGRQFPVEWLAQKISDPERLRVGTGQTEMMPVLGLSDAEIAAVVSYVNYRPQAATATVGR